MWWDGKGAEVSTFFTKEHTNPTVPVEGQQPLQEQVESAEGGTSLEGFNTERGAFLYDFEFDIKGEPGEEPHVTVDEFAGHVRAFRDWFVRSAELYGAATLVWEQAEKEKLLSKGMPRIFRSGAVRFGLLGILSLCVSAFESDEARGRVSLILSGLSQKLAEKSKVVEPGTPLYQELLKLEESNDLEALFLKPTDRKFRVLGATQANELFGDVILECSKVRRDGGDSITMSPERFHSLDCKLKNLAPLTEYEREHIEKFSADHPEMCTPIIITNSLLSARSEEKRQMIYHTIKRGEIPFYTPNFEPKGLETAQNERTIEFQQVPIAAMRRIATGHKTTPSFSSSHADAAILTPGQRWPRAVEGHVGNTGFGLERVVSLSYDHTPSPGSEPSDFWFYTPSGIRGNQSASEASLEQKEPFGVSASNSGRSLTGNSSLALKGPEKGCLAQNGKDLIPSPVEGEEDRLERVASWWERRNHVTLLAALSALVSYLHLRLLPRMQANADFLSQKGFPKWFCNILANSKGARSDEKLDYDYTILILLFNLILLYLAFTC